MPFVSDQVVEVSKIAFASFEVEKHCFNIELIDKQAIWCAAYGRSCSFSCYPS